MIDEKEEKEQETKKDESEINADKDMSFTKTEEVKPEKEEEPELFDTTKDYAELKPSEKKLYKESLKNEFMAFVTEEAKGKTYGKPIFQFYNNDQPETFSGTQQLFNVADKDKTEKEKILYNNTNV